MDVIDRVESRLGCRLVLSRETAQIGRGESDQDMRQEERARDDRADHGKPQDRW